MEPFPFEDEESLRRRCVEADPDAWAAFCARYALHVAGVIRNILAQRALPARRDDVGEAVAEFFGDLCAARRETLGAFRGDGSFRAYLAVLAANHARRRAESERRLRGRFGAPVDSIADDAHYSVAAGSGIEEAEEVAVVIAGLAAADRSLYRVLYVEELEPEAAAERLGVTRSALYIRKCRFLKRVRAALDERSADRVPSQVGGKRESSQGHGTR